MSVQSYKTFPVIVNEMLNRANLNRKLDDLVRILLWLVREYLCEHILRSIFLRNKVFITLMPLSKIYFLSVAFQWPWKLGTIHRNLLQYDLFRLLCYSLFCLGACISIRQKHDDLIKRS